MCALLWMPGEAMAHPRCVSPAPGRPGGKAPGRSPRRMGRWLTGKDWMMVFPSGRQARRRDLQLAIEGNGLQVAVLAVFVVHAAAVV